MKTLDDLLDQDRQRKADGFPEKIKIGKLIVPGSKNNTVVVIPTATEEKFHHGHNPMEEETTGGQGEGEEGETVEQEQDADSPPSHQAGSEGGGEHGAEKDAYEMGRLLTEKFQLPNIKDKGKKVAIDNYIYDLTDRHQGAGQILDKKATLRQIVKTNNALGNLDVDDIDTTKLLIAPRDKIYRVLSKEKSYESQAIVFFIRDYSGSMDGAPTKVVVAQHLMIYSWLVFQYNNRVKSRFILHDTEAKEVSDFQTYFGSRTQGGTEILSAYNLLNEIVDRENLAKDYNLYVFQGTDGDDQNGDDYSQEIIKQAEKILAYANRFGLTVAKNDWSYARDRKTIAEEYLAGLLNSHPDLFKLEVLTAAQASDDEIAASMKRLIS